MSETLLADVLRVCEPLEVIINEDLLKNRMFGFAYDEPALLSKYNDEYFIFKNYDDTELRNLIGEKLSIDDPRIQNWDNKVDRAGDTMTGGLTINADQSPLTVNLNGEPLFLSEGIAHEHKEHARIRRSLIIGSESSDYNRANPYERTNSPQLMFRDDYDAANSYPNQGNHKGFLFHFCSAPNEFVTGHKHWNNPGMPTNYVWRSQDTDIMSLESIGGSNNVLWAPRTVIRGNPAGAEALTVRSGAGEERLLTIYNNPFQQVGVLIRNQLNIGSVDFDRQIRSAGYPGINLRADFSDTQGLYYYFCAYPGRVYNEYVDWGIEDGRLGTEKSSFNWCINKEFTDFTFGRSSGRLFLFCASRDHNNTRAGALNVPLLNVGNNYDIGSFQTLPNIGVGDIIAQSKIAEGGQWLSNKYLHINSPAVSAHRLTSAHNLTLTGKVFGYTTTDWSGSVILDVTAVGLAATDIPALDMGKIATGNLHWDRVSNRPSSFAPSAHDINGTMHTGTLSVSRGGTGATTLTGLLRGNGTGAFSALAIGTNTNQYLANNFTWQNLPTIPDVSGMLTIDSIRRNSSVANFNTVGETLGVGFFNANGGAFTNAPPGVSAWASLLSFDIGAGGSKRGIQLCADDTQADILWYRQCITQGTWGTWRRMALGTGTTSQLLRGDGTLSAAGTASQVRAGNNDLLNYTEQPVAGNLVLRSTDGNVGVYTNWFRSDGNNATPNAAQQIFVKTGDNFMRTRTPAQLRGDMGLGNTTGALPIENGGTGSAVSPFNPTTWPTNGAPINLGGNLRGRRWAGNTNLSAGHNIIATQGSFGGSNIVSYGGWFQYPTTPSTRAAFGTYVNASVWSTIVLPNLSNVNFVVNVPSALTNAAYDVWFTYTV